VAVLILILALFGISDYSDFRKTIHGATDELKPQLDQALAESEKATHKAQDAENKAEAASKLIEAATAKMNTQLSTADRLSNKVNGLESQAANQIASANKRVEDRVNELDKKVEEANRSIASQQTKLLSTNELVTAMFSKSQVETFRTDQGNTSTFALMPLPQISGAARNAPKAMVHMLLKSAPIYQTVQINFHIIYIQPKSSYFVNGNDLVFAWGDPPESLKQWPLEVSYVPDPTYYGTIYKQLTVRNNGVSAN
jgi:hypothetical protein